MSPEWSRVIYCRPHPGYRAWHLTAHCRCHVGKNSDPSGGAWLCPDHNNPDAYASGQRAIQGVEALVLAGDLLPDQTWERTYPELVLLRVVEKGNWIDIGVRRST